MRNEFVFIEKITVILPKYFIRKKYVVGTYLFKNLFYIKILVSSDSVVKIKLRWVRHITSV